MLPVLVIIMAARSRMRKNLLDVAASS